MAALSGRPGDPPLTDSQRKLVIALHVRRSQLIWPLSDTLILTPDPVYEPQARLLIVLLDPPWFETHLRLIPAGPQPT